MSALIRGTCIGILLAGCTHLEPGDSAPRHPAVNPWSVPEPIPRVEPRSARGNPAEYHQFGKTYRVLDSARGFRERGVASWYGTKFHGRATSSGEPYDMYKLTAAHPTLPLPTYIRVHNLDNGRELIVRVNDRGPFAHGRILDLSYAAAVQLGVFANGSARVEIEAIDPGTSAPVNMHDVAEPMPQRPATSGQFTYLQIGAFSNHLNRDTLKEDLFRRGVPNVLERSGPNDQGIMLHRVWVGPYSDASKLEQARERLRQMGYSSTLITE